MAKGCSQSLCVNFNETYSPVSRLSTIRVLMCLTLQSDMTIDYLDISPAFLNEELEEQMFVDQPEGFVMEKNKVCRLKKAIYGLRQSAKAWQSRIHTVLIKLGFKAVRLAYIINQSNVKVIICMYVNDILLINNCEMGKCRVKEQLNSQFALKDLGEAKSLLGIRIRRENDKTCLDQKNYIIETLYKFNLFDCKPANTPYAVETRQRANASDDRLYQEPLG